MSRSHVEGDILRLSPEWIGWAYWVLLICLMTALLFSGVTRIHDWTSGTAVVRLIGRRDLTALAPGTVASIDVRPGQHVEPEQILVRFWGVDEQRALQGATGEFEAVLLKVLRDPFDEATRKELARTRIQKQLAEARLADRAVRAPHAGTVTEVRIRPGQLLQAGDIILTLVNDQTKPQVVVLLPGHALPEVKVGMPMRFEPSKFEFAYQSLVVESIGTEVLGPSEIRRYLGPELADAVEIQGPSFIVTATLPSMSFMSDHKTYLFSQGLPGRAQVRLRSRNILMAFVPELRRLMSHVDKSYSGD
jgi:membrane fusion protein (multidrug efflux system)